MLSCLRPEREPLARRQRPLPLHSSPSPPRRSRKKEFFCVFVCCRPLFFFFDLFFLRPFFFRPLWRKKQKSKTKNQTLSPPGDPVRERRQIGAVRVAEEERARRRVCPGEERLRPRFKGRDARRGQGGGDAGDPPREGVARLVVERAGRGRLAHDGDGGGKWRRGGGSA